MLINLLCFDISGEHPAFIVSIQQLTTCDLWFSKYRQLHFFFLYWDTEPLRQSQYLNQVVEQDHRFLKRLTNPGLGFASFHTAWRTLPGYEIINMIRKGRLERGTKGD